MGDKECLNCSEKLTGRQKKYCSKECGREYRKIQKLAHIIVDTREQKPLFDEDYPKLTVNKLDEGDYSAKGHEDCITIERKSLSDWVGCTTGNDRDRLEREIKRAKDKTFYLMIESNMDDMWAGHWASKTRGATVIATAISWMEKYSWVKTVFVSNRSNAKYFVKKLLQKHKEYCDKK